METIRPISTTNPFRKLNHNYTPSSTAEQVAASIFDSPDRSRAQPVPPTGRPTSSRSSKPSKKVRVQSPPPSPVTSRPATPPLAVQYNGKPDTWPVEESASRQVASTPSSSASTIVPDTLVRDARLVLEPETVSALNSEAPSLSARVPSNPFSKTLYDIKPRAVAADASPSAPTSIDVDAFSRLLLTGVASPPSSTSSIAGDSQPPLVSGSSDPVSSIAHNNTSIQARAKPPPPPPPPSRQNRYPRETSRDLRGKPLRDIDRPLPAPPPPAARRGSDMQSGESSIHPLASSIALPPLTRPAASRNYSKSDPPMTSPSVSNIPPNLSTEPADTLLAERRASVDSSESYFSNAPAPPPPRRGSRRPVSVNATEKLTSSSAPSPTASARPSSALGSPTSTSFASRAPATAPQASPQYRPSTESLRSIANVASLSMPGSTLAHSLPPPLPPPPPPPPARSMSTRSSGMVGRQENVSAQEAKKAPTLPDRSRTASRDARASVPAQQLGSTDSNLD